MIKKIKDALEITKKDLIEFSRDKIRLITFFIMPLFMMLMVGFIFPNQNTIKDIPIGVTNYEKNNLSDEFLKILSELSLNKKDKAFKLKYYKNLEAIKGGIKKQEIHGGIYLPKEFTQKIKNNEEVEIIIIKDEANPQISTITTQALSELVKNFGQKIGNQKLKQVLLKINYPNYKDSKNNLIKRIQNPFKIKIEGLFPAETNYFQFVAPGIIAMVVMTAVLTGLAASISREKEQGTLDGILVAPISRISIILGKTLSQSIRGLIQGIIILLLAIIFFHVKIAGSFFLVILILILGIFSFVGFGILVSALATEQETATQLLFMFQLPMLFLSGVFFPIEQMPKSMQYISKMIPLTYAIRALRKVIVLGGNIQSLLFEILILFLFGFFALLIAVPTFKKIITK